MHRILKKYFRSSFFEENPIDKKTAIVCITVACSLSVIFYGGQTAYWFRGLGILMNDEQLAQIRQIYEEGYWSRLIQLLHWFLFNMIGFVLMPMLVIRYVLKEKIKLFGLEQGIQRKEWGWYLLAISIMLPLVFSFSFMPAFQERYPFFQEAHRLIDQRLIIWEFAYMVQFFAVEFFFRGFMLHGIKQKLGVHAVFVMTIPYCMIHFAKPFPETMAAIIAGIVLGLISLRTRSIWLGVLLHCSVAITMDLLALWQKGMIG